MRLRHQSQFHLRQKPAKTHVRCLARRPIIIIITMIYYHSIFYVYIYIYISLYTYIYIYMYVYMYVCVYICM